MALQLGSVRHICVEWNTGTCHASMPDLPTESYTTYKDVNFGYLNVGRKGNKRSDGFICSIRVV